MKIDISQYDTNKKYIQEWYSVNKEKYGTASLGIIASATGCPCIAVIYWFGEIDNWDVEIIKSIKSLKKFYRYTEIVGIPNNCLIKFEEL